MLKWVYRIPFNPCKQQAAARLPCGLANALDLVHLGLVLWGCWLTLPQAMAVIARLHSPISLLSPFPWLFPVWLF